ncbi:MAG: hypothetical protein KHW57_07940 [Clostridium sp.]|nr:hypothetical protein [Clostridium sp.]
MQKINNSNSHLQDIDEDALNISYDVSENKDHAALIIFRYEKDVIRVLSTIHDKEAKLIYNLLNGALPSIEDVVYILEKYYSLQDIAIISGKLRKTVLSKAGSQLTVSYLENGTLLRSTTNASS